MLKHYVEYLYLYSGTIIHTTVIREISKRNPQKVEVTNDCMGFRFFDGEVSPNGNRVIKMENISGWYYCNCEKIKFEDAQKVFKDNMQYEELKKYMETKGIGYLVKTKSRHYIPLRNEDTVL